MTEPMSDRRSFYLPQDDGNAILLDYYDGAYGKTLRIDVQSTKSLEVLLRFLKAFETGASIETSISQMKEVVLVPPLVEVRLAKSGASNIVAKETATETVIEWGNRQEDWEFVLEMVTTLGDRASAGGSGHQYLTQPKARILVELAFRE